MNAHSQAIFEEYKSNLSNYELISDIVSKTLHDTIKANNLYVNAIECRVKTPESLEGKLKLKGDKYSDIYDITDIVGARVITFYKNDVDKIASIAEKLFEIDWQNSVDKRAANAPNAFGYASLHYICTIPKNLYFDPANPEINNIKFELQMRTILQHLWATAFHDSGYKSDIEVPKEQIRNLYRLASLLEIADEEFSTTLNNIDNYRRKVSKLVKEGSFDDLSLDINTFNSYMDINPFDNLNSRIAGINNAELEPVSAFPYYNVLKNLGFESIGEIEKSKEMYSDDAFKLAVAQLSNTDADILSSTIGIQNLLIVYAIRKGLGTSGVKTIFDSLYENGRRNEAKAHKMIDKANSLGIIEETQY